MTEIDIESLRKRGKFNASMCFKLLSKGNYVGIFGEPAQNHIMEAVVEMVTRREDFVAEGNPLVQMEHGKKHEYDAYVYYLKVTGNKDVKHFAIVRSEFTPAIDIADEFGCYPDGGIITNDRTVSLGIEIKCPYDSNLHMDRLKWRSQWDIRDNYSRCYAQIQANLMFTGAKEWHFISYDDRQIIDRFKIKIIPVFPDLKFQEDLLFRLKEAIKEKYRLLSEYIGKEVNNRGDFIEKIQKMC